MSDPVGSGWVLAGALAFFLIGCIMLAIGGTSLGALHAFAAFVVLAVVAALNQLLPVLTHAPVAPPHGVIASAAAFAIGFALLIAGFAGAPTFVAAGVILALASTGWVIWNVVRLIAGRDETQTRVLMVCAIAAFVIAAWIGATMACTLGSRCAAPLATLAPLHAVLAIVGFASLLIAVISYRFVPMFAMAHDSVYGKRVASWVATASAAAIALSLHSPLALRIGLIALLVSATWIAISHLLTLKTRLRKRIDVSLRYGAIAWMLGLLAILTAIGATWQIRLQTATVILAVLGWISITILGYAYKIAGFLAWQRAKDRAPEAQLTPLSSAVHLPLAYAALALMGAGSIAAAVCSVVRPDDVRIGYDIYAAGGTGAVIALARLASLYVFKERSHGTEAPAA